MVTDDAASCYNEKNIPGEGEKVDWALLKKSVLFEGLSGEETERALAFFDARESTFLKGDTVKPIHTPFIRFGLVLQGTVQVFSDDLEGRQMLMAHVEKGGMFGESLSYLQKDEPVYAVAGAPCRILWLHPGNIRKLQPQTPLETLLIHRFISLLATRALRMNDRIQILSKITLEEKVKALLSLYQKRMGAVFTLPFSRTELAAYLAVNRSALSRVLGQMQKRGLFTMEGRRFTLHQSMEE